MVLNNDEIRNLCERQFLLDRYNPFCIQNCSYTIRIDELICPQTGKIITPTNKNPFHLKTSNIVLFQSEETINLPHDITASFSALYSVSSRGILLINASMIEPSYKGKLSGILLNFSSQDFLLYPKQEIAKIVFYKLASSPTHSKNEIIEDEQYRKDLREKAMNYHESFLNIGNLKAEIQEYTFKKAKHLLYRSGFVIAGLILFATLEPIFSNWIYKRTGTLTKTEVNRLENAILEKKYQSDFREMKKKLDSLTNIIISIKKDAKHGK